MTEVELEVKSDIEQLSTEFQLLTNNNSIEDGCKQTYSAFDQFSEAIKNHRKDLALRLCEECENDATAVQFLKILEISNDYKQTELGALVLLYLAKKKYVSIKAKIESLCMELVNSVMSRLIRKTAVATLKLITEDDGIFWPQYFTILDTLEEPQFHLVEPVLPKIVLLVNDFFLCSDCQGEDDDRKRYYWSWMEVLFTKALMHPNGWIRNWILLKIIFFHYCSCYYTCDFMVNVLFPALDNNDVYWRLLENKQLENFIVDFRSFFSAMIRRMNDENAVRLLEAVLEQFSKKPSVGPSYYFSCYLTDLDCGRKLTAASIPLLKRALLSCRNIQYRCLKFGIVKNLVEFFIRKTLWTIDTVWSFSCIFSYIIEFERDNNIAGLLEFAAESITAAWSSSDDDNFSFFSAQCKYLDFANALNLFGDAMLAYARCLWIIVEHYGTSTDLLQTIVAKLFESGLDSLKFLEFNSLMTACLVGFPVYSCGLASATRESFFLYLREIYEYGLFEETGTEMRKALMVDVLNVMCSTCSGRKKYAEIFDSKNTVFKDCHFDIEALIEYAKCYSNSFTYGEIYIAPLRLYFTKYCDRDNVLSDILELFQKSLVWSEKKILFYILRAVLNEGTANHMLVAMKTMWSAVMEEKNSRFYLGLLEQLLSVLLQKNALLPGSVQEKYAMNYVSKIIEDTPNNSQVYCLLTEKIFDVVEYLSFNWMKLLFVMNLYGQIPSKDAKVVIAASKHFFAVSQNALPIQLQFSNVDKLHNAMHYGRLQVMFSLFLLLNRARKFSHGETPYGELLINNVDYTMEKAVSGKDSSYGLSLAHRQKTKLFQTLLLLTYSLNTDDMRHVYYWCIGWITKLAQQYSVKLLLEFILMRCLDVSSELVDDFVSRESLASFIFATEFAVERIGAITSWINVLMHVALGKYQSDEGDEKHLVELCFSLFLPWCTAQNFSIRVTAIAALKCLFNSVNTSIQFDYIKKIINFEAEPKGNGRRIVQMLCTDFYFAVFNPKVNFNWQAVLEIFPRKTGMPDEEIILPELFSEVLEEKSIRIPNLYEPNTVLDHSPSLIFAKLSTQADKQVLLNRTFEVRVHERVSESDASHTSIAECHAADGEIQRKFNVLRGKWRKPVGKSILVIASLIDKATNLGGICRTCEVFGVEKLIIADLNVLNDKQFRSLSTSSEKWMDFEQVRPNELIEYLKKCRTEGYTVIASEQSTNSVCFHKFQIPPKSALLLGDERKGVPVDLLRFADVIVEIPQYGQTGSLNVHVSAALFIEKYAETHYGTLS